jgi:hypothetical protein
MEKKIFYAFDDETVSKFCYDLNLKKIELHFEAYFDILKNESVEEPCVWTIENWKEAKSAEGDNPKLYSIEKNISIFYLIIYFKLTESNDLEIFVETINDKYITFIFKEPTLTFKSKEYP